MQRLDNLEVENVDFEMKLDGADLPPLERGRAMQV